MKSLKEIFEEKRDIKESEIPDGKKFRSWYYQNQKTIERDMQINKLLLF